MTDAEKLALITTVVDRQISAQNDDDGDKYQADANLAMEAIDRILAGDLDSSFVRTFFPEGVK